jgi:hypothetical protein
VCYSDLQKKYTKNDFSALLQTEVKSKKQKIFFYFSTKLLTIKQKNEKTNFNPLHFESDDEFRTNL